MTHKTEQELQDSLELCPKGGTYWKHKKTGHIYTVMDKAIQESTLEPLVLYQRWGGSSLFINWSRPLSDFLVKFTRGHFLFCGCGMRVDYFEPDPKPMYCSICEDCHKMKREENDQ